MTVALSVPTMETLLFDHALFTPIIDPDTIRGATYTSSREKRLVAAVIQQAIDDARGKIGCCKSPRLKQQISADADAWLADTESPNDERGRWSLAFCCEVLDCPPNEASAKAAALVRAADPKRRLKRVRDTSRQQLTIAKPRPRGCGRGHRKRAA